MSIIHILLQTMTSELLLEIITTLICGAMLYFGYLMLTVPLKKTHDLKDYRFLIASRENLLLTRELGPNTTYGRNEVVAAKVREQPRTATLFDVECGEHLLVTVKVKINITKYSLALWFNEHIKQHPADLSLKEFPLEFIFPPTPYDAELMLRLANSVKGLNTFTGKVEDVLNRLNFEYLMPQVLTSTYSGTVEFLSFVVKQKVLHPQPVKPNSLSDVD